MAGWKQRVAGMCPQAMAGRVAIELLAMGAAIGGCTLPTSEPKLLALRPSTIYEGQETSLVLTGSNLVGVDRLSLDGSESLARGPSWTVYLDETPLSAQAVASIRSDQLVADIPAGLSVGSYSLRLVSVEGLSVLSPQPLVVVPRESARADSAANGTDRGELSNAATVAPAGQAPSDCSSSCETCSMGQCCQAACGALGCPECPMGCACLRSCSAGDLCEMSCSAGSSCWLDSQAAEVNEMQCSQASCALTCEGGSGCAMSCAEGSHCDMQTQFTGGSELQCDASACSFNCTGEASCQMSCRSNASCELDCTDSGSCSVQCDESAACLVRCFRVGECLALCDNPTDCGDGVFACNRACP